MQDQDVEETFRRVAQSVSCHFCWGQCRVLAILAFSNERKSWRAYKGKHGLFHWEKICVENDTRSEHGD